MSNHPHPFLQRSAATVQRITNGSITAENLISVLKTLAWVAPLTILIWIYAEREQEIKAEAIFPIAVKSANPNRVIKIRGDETISAKLVGPNAAVERVSEFVRRTGPNDLPVIQIELGGEVPADGNWHPIDTKRFIAGNPVFHSQGVTVEDCSPKQLMVLVDEIAERETEVHPPRSVTNLVGTSVFEPKTVRVRGPRTLLDAAKQTLHVEADLSGREELNAPGPHEIAAVPVRASVEDPSITIVPSTVRATIEVGQSDKRLTIPSIPIWASGPPGTPALLEKYKAEYNPVLTNITLIGPPDKIALLQNNPDMQPIATLYVRREDIGKPSQDRRVTVNLPEGIFVAKEDEAKLHVQFKLVELTAGE